MTYEIRVQNIITATISEVYARELLRKNGKPSLAKALKEGQHFREGFKMHTVILLHTGANDEWGLWACDRA